MPGYYAGFDQGKPASTHAETLRVPVLSAGPGNRVPPWHGLTGDALLECLIVTSSQATSPKDMRDFAARIEAEISRETYTRGFFTPMLVFWATHHIGSLRGLAVRLFQAMADIQSAKAETRGTLSAWSGLFYVRRRFGARYHPQGI